MNILSTIKKDIINLVYPNLCAACDAELLGNEYIICVSCWRVMPKTKFHLQSNNPFEQKFFGRIPIQHGSAMYYFNKDTRIQAALHALKYQHKKQIGIELGRRFGEEIKDCSWIKEIDMLIPIPLSKQKFKIRGYNQSEYIAIGLSDSLHIPLNTISLIRKKNTQSQTSMSIAERADNVKDAFEVTQPSALLNKHILLIDDVLTTGATLESGALEILKIQNTKISVLTIAYAIV